MNPKEDSAVPLIVRSTYLRPAWLVGRHAQTVFPAFFRKVPSVSYTRHHVATPDDDILCIDMHRVGNKPAENILFALHGLEGDSRQKYIYGMCRAFAAIGWDTAAGNFRCCGGEMNVQPCMYHGGRSEDVRTVVEYCLGLGYRRIFLVGFSMGGNQILKYLGEAGEAAPEAVVGAAVFSVPCDLAGDLAGSVRRLDRLDNVMYMRNFLSTLRGKIRKKHARWPELYPLARLERIRSFTEFDARYTAPVHGFASAQDYYTKASCLPVLEHIRKPVLLVSARNDPFLSKSCYPYRIAKNSEYLFLETPKYGGHVGFTPHIASSVYWSEVRAVEFLQSLL